MSPISITVLITFGTFDTCTKNYFFLFLFSEEHFFDPLNFFMIRPCLFKTTSIMNPKVDKKWFLFAGFCSS